MRRKKFDLIESPLANGRTLIEASAGTGKTYTIAGIVLRLILEKNLGVGEILVTTYTELATAELRDRIRRLIRDALTGFETGHAPNELVAALLEREREPAETARRLRLALQTFDEAPIYTIHGFCQRMLKDRAFESGALFDAELIIDQTPILREIVDDFWRSHFYAGDPMIANFALENGLSPEKLLQLLFRLTNNPTLVVEPPLESKFDPLARQFVTLTATAGPVGNEASQGELFAGCEELRVVGRKLLVSLEAKFLAWARAEMKRRKAQRNLLSFDDMLTRLNDSLGAEGGAALARSIRDRFKAALVDEFQDTDPIQYSIFEKIYTGSDASVFFIGDPKQAIYGFRGADVFTYIAAAQATPAAQQFTLGKNWRSEAPLVRAVNTVFTARDRPFVLEGIGFEPVEAAGKADGGALTAGTLRKSPLQVWLATNEKPITDREANRLLPKAVAGEIGRLLNGDLKLGEEKVEPRQIAVLVATNAEARIVQDALAGAHIPSVLYSAADVFKSHEALELERILAAVIEPTHERVLKAALTADALGLTGEALEALTRDDRAWETRLIQFQKYHRRWQEKGFVQMLRTLLLEQGVRARLLSYPDGERRLTNMLHLAELLHRLCNESRLGMNGLLKRLGEQIRDRNATHSEEYELRLERDEKAVRVVTIHRSKGLEYDIVFCPYSWSGSEINKNQDLVFHDEGRLILDLEKTGAHRQTQVRERLAEEVRLLYVALTRARHRCYFVWGNFKGGQNSGLGHLLGKEESGTPRSTGIRDRIYRALGGEPAIELVELDDIQPQLYRPAPEDTLPLMSLAFNREIDCTYGISSFTRLISGHGSEPEAPDEDAIEVEEPEAPSAPLPEATGSIFDFPRGTGPGTCLHHILEDLDFTDLAAMPDLVRSKLNAFSIHGFDAAVCEMIRNTMRVPLEPTVPQLSLSSIAKEARLSELEFYFPVGAVERDSLVELLGDRRLQFQPLSGFLKGFIDLVFAYHGRFYIVDWKSNWLGPIPDAYSTIAMEAEMARRFYHLQLSIYAVALHRFLRARQPGYTYEKNFGATYYLFLRGIRPAQPELGVYRARPSLDFVSQLDAVLTDDN
jgi:exodeoxyribonuclease V beta subunit